MKRFITFGFSLAVGLTQLVEPSWGYRVVAVGTAAPVTSTVLYQFRPLYCSADLKRFATADPIGIEGGLNRYVYGSDNPLAFLDPLGLCSISQDDGSRVDSSYTVGMLRRQSFIDRWQDKPLLGPAVHATDAFQNGQYFRAAWYAADTAIQTYFAVAGVQGFLSTKGAPIMGKGSSVDLNKGTSFPRNLREQLAVDEAAASPNAGTRLPIDMTDPRWPSTKGWQKMQQIIEPGGEPITVHYVQNPVIQQVDDFKIVVDRVNVSAWRK